MEHREARADLLGEREQVELDAELAVVALLGFLEPVQVLGERVLRLPRGAVDALEHRALLVAAPVRARDLRELERAELAGRRHVRAAAQVGEARRRRSLDVAVHRDAAPSPPDLARVFGVGVARAHLLDDLALVRLVGEHLRARRRSVSSSRTKRWSSLTILRISSSICARSSSGNVSPSGQLEVVVEAVGDRGTDRVLRAREQPRDRFGQHVRGRVPQHLAAVVGVGHDDLRARCRGRAGGRGRSTRRRPLPRSRPSRARHRSTRRRRPASCPSDSAWSNRREA